MMEDWTDIIGDSLKDNEETLPADDWSVLQRKYASVRRKKRRAAIAWVSGVMSVAAAVAIVFFVVHDDEQIRVSDDIVAEIVPRAEEQVADMEPSDKEDMISVLPAKTGLLAEAPIPSGETSHDIVNEATKPVEIDKGNDNPDDERIDNHITERIDNHTIAEDRTNSGNGILFEEDLQDDKPEPRRRRMSVGLSASVSGIPGSTGNMDMADLPLYGNPKDSLSTSLARRGPAVMKKQEQYWDSYSHQIPISVGLSFRFGITDRLSINTGLNYTRYASTRERIYIGTAQPRKDRQYAHYIGIPVRLDWIPVNRKRFNFYIGAGFTIDKCIYASVGGERLKEKQVLFGVNGNVGIQVNLVPKAGLFLEPEISYNLNKGTIETYRFEHPLMLSARAGLRLSF